MFSNTEKVRRRNGNTICSPDSRYDRKGLNFGGGDFTLTVRKKTSNSKDGRTLKPIPQGNCGFSVIGCL